MNIDYFMMKYGYISTWVTRSLKIKNLRLFILRKYLRIYFGVMDFLCHNVMCCLSLRMELNTEQVYHFHCLSFLFLRN